MSMRAKPLARRNAIFVNDTQRAKLDVLCVVVVRKGKSVERFEPTVIGIASFVTAANLQHDALAREYIRLALH
jgi:hypothetical protein